MPELIIIIVYFLIIIVIGIVSRKKAREADDFFVAGRKSSAWFVTGSLLATVIGGSATIGMAGFGFTRGLTGAWWILVGSIGLIVLGLFFTGKVRKFALYTLPELIEKQYDRRVAFASSILIVIAWIGVIAAQIIAAGTIMSVLDMGSRELWMVIFSVVFILYTLLGGQYSVLRTDLFQSVIIFGGIFAGVGVLLTKLGGWGGFYTSLPKDMFAFPVNSQFDGMNLLYYLLIVGLTYVVGPDMYSRIFCARDDKTARISTFTTAGLLIPIALAITVIGMGAAVLFPQISAEQALPTVIKEIFSPLLGGVVLAALLCAVMSSADTTLLSASTILSVDVIGKFRPTSSDTDVLPRSRWIILILGICSLIVALLLKGIISSLLFAYTVYTCGVTLPVIFGFFRDKLRITGNGALAALIGGGGMGLFSKLAPYIDDWLNLDGTLASVKYLELWALLASAALLFLVSYIDRQIKNKSA
jgi:SSS family solute:Na+ symporter